MESPDLSGVCDQPLRFLIETTKWLYRFLSRYFHRTMNDQWVSSPESEGYCLRDLIADESNFALTSTDADLSV